MSEFYPKAMRKSWGYSSECKQCLVSKKCKWQKENKAIVNARWSKRYHGDIDKYRQKRRDWYDSHSPEWKSEYLKELNRKYPKSAETNILNCTNRRARRRNARGNLTKAVWKDIIRFYNNSCLCCGKDDIKITVDHIKPLILGGKNDVENVQPLCHSCNSRKGGKSIDYRGNKIYGQQ